MIEPGFYLGDCMNYLKDMPDKSIDLAVCDPPYGINVGKASMGMGGGKAPHRNRSARRAAETNNTSRSAASATQNGGGARIGGAKPFGQSGRGTVISPKIYKAFDDSRTPGAAYFEELRRVAKNIILWGGNYFLDHLGATECMIIWDKRRRGLNFADCEIAWTNIKQPCRIFEFKWNGMLQEDMKNKEYRIHPTQKPVELYKWILSRYAHPGDLILDTHVGSGSSLVACREMGFKYIGFEIDPDYYEEAKKRVDAAEAQVNIFDFM